MDTAAELHAWLWFAAIVGALVILFAFGARLQLPQSGVSRWLGRLGIAGGAFVVTLLANMALYGHDTHLDVTREEAFTPSTEAQKVVRDLHQPLELTYFYKKRDPAAQNVLTTLHLLAHLNPMLRLELIDTDQNPARATEMGVRIYNTAIMRTSARRVEVVTTDDNEIAFAMLRAMRERDIVICFATGHGEYDIDNFQFQTHFEGLGGRGERLVVQMEDHGLGRLKRDLDKLGISARKTPLAAGQDVPADCAALVEANPRTRFSPPETSVLRAYLEGGGSLLLLIEPGYELDDSLSALLTEAGVRVGDGFVVDPNGHYFTDEQMIAVSTYNPHPITQGLSMSIYPGARPVDAIMTPDGSGPITAGVLLSSTPSSYVIANREVSKDAADTAPRGSQPLAVAAQGRLSAQRSTTPYRLVVFGDADFASNSFFPYLANSDVVLNTISWLAREQKAPVARPVIEDVPRVVLTGSQAQGIFIFTVLLLPGAVTLLGGLVWWRRRS
jgi:hypothetical protein